MAYVMSCALLAGIVLISLRSAGARQVVEQALLSVVLIPWLIEDEAD